MPSSGVQTCARSEEHTSELQSHSHLVCRLLLEKKEELVALARHRLGVIPGAHQGRPALRHVAPPHMCVLPSVAYRPLPFIFVFFFFFLNNRAPPEISPFPLPGPLRI